MLLKYILISLIIIFLATAQYLAFRFFKKFFSKIIFIKLLKTIFIGMNLLWLMTIIFMIIPRTTPNDFLIKTFFRFAIIWQVLSLGWLIFISSIKLVIKFFKWLFSKNEDTKIFYNKDQLSLVDIFSFCTFIIFISIGFYGVYIENQAPIVLEKTIQIKNLDPRLDGITIAHLSDTHIGLWKTQEELDRSLEIVAARKPDFIFFTGDMVDRSADAAKLYKKPLLKVNNTPYGVWGVLGNHDHYVNAEQVEKNLIESGIRILSDERVNLTELPISIIGFDDPGRKSSWTGSKNNKNSFYDFNRIKGPEIPKENYVILLNHRPENIDEAAAQGVNLYLAGHTHCGQIAIPGFEQLNISTINYKYNNGLYKKNDCVVNVSCGMASIGIPFRFMVWPEINILRLKRI